MSSQQVAVGRRFHGPPDSGNGGYVAGLVARALRGSGCTVTLHRPPPLEWPLELRTTPQGAALMDGEELIASAAPAEPAELDLDTPGPPPLDEARAAEQRYVGYHRHRFPACFVCGPQRAEGDGLQIFPGDIEPARVAASWMPGADLGAADGTVRTEFIWAALDCPGYFAVEEAADLALLGRMTAVVERAAAIGEALIVSGWRIESHGRKHHVGTALHDAAGRLVARARSTWISVG